MELIYTDHEYRKKGVDLLSQTQTVYGHLDSQPRNVKFLVVGKMQN